MILTCPSCGSKALKEFERLEVRRFRGNNYDMVKYEIKQRCRDCAFVNHTTRSERELVNPNFKDVDASDHRRISPTRHGT